MIDQTDSSNTRRPWYREPLVWMLIALPASAVLGGIVTIVIAVRTSDGLVADDYYKQGLAINQTIARDEVARKMGLEADIQISEGRVGVVLRARSGTLPEMLHLTLAHPTRAGEDQAIELTGRGSDYRGELGMISAGRWGIHLEDPSRNWRMNGEAYLPSAQMIRISSAAGAP